MKTQLAATPTLYGEDARILLESVKSKPSKKAKENGKKLIEMFKCIESQNN